MIFVIINCARYNTLIPIYVYHVLHSDIGIASAL